MNKRPKSREETPKEGSDSARRYRTATICDRAAQNARAFKAFPMQITHCVYANNAMVASKIPKTLQELIKSPSPIYRDWRLALVFVIDRVTKNALLPTADSCMQNASVNRQIEVRRLPDWARQ
jgi:hypothetical protein